MKMWTETITLETKQKREYIDLTPHVKDAAKKSGIVDGLVFITALHSNAGVFVNMGEPGLLADLDAMLEQLAPHREDYQHGKGHESNASAHLKSVLVGHDVTLSLEQGRVDLGPWQQLYFAEFDGPRPRRVLIKILGE